MSHLGAPPDGGGPTARLQAAARQDGASNNRFEIAHGKAYGALALGMGSWAISARSSRRTPSPPRRPA
ncbi:heme-binding protein [Arthrobacter antioxidans]|uniref:heme-binding protein n=1 Tax=Arthrobacter antioxidans TaxID=2895818 RepID=UPI003AF0D423